MTTRQRYSGISTLNHWVTAILVIIMLVLGLAAAGAPDDTTEHYLMGIHIGLGFFVLLFVAWRIAYRLYEGFPENIGPTAFERRAAYLMHRALLLLIALQVITGPLYLFTESEGVNVFGWFTLYIPLEFLSAVHEPAESVHVVLGLYVLPVLLVLHLLGAVKHYWNRRQETPADM